VGYNPATATAGSTFSGGPFMLGSAALPRYLGLLLMLGAVLGGTALAQHEEAFPFTGPDGVFPSGGLVADSAGNLYGATALGGNFNGCSHNEGCGVIFEISPPRQPGGQWTETTLYKFAGIPDGENPNGDLVIDGAGNLYGTTTEGGNGCSTRNGCGTVFELSPPSQPGGSWTESVLFSFGGLPTGNVPLSGLTFDQKGNLYGTTFAGGFYGSGVLFELSPPPVEGGSWTESVLHNFGFPFTDGASPAARVIFDSAGNLYGTTTFGGRSDVGTVYEFSPPAQVGTAWTEQVLHSFGNFDTDGEQPLAGLTLTPGGLLLGTAATGGAFGGGVVFVLFPPGISGGIWTYTIGHNFGGGIDGIRPASNLTFMYGSQPVLYGTTESGAPFGAGTVYELTPPAGVGQPLTESVLYRFTNGPDGGVPQAGVIVQGDALYGTTASGGYQAMGTVFRFSP